MDPTRDAPIVAVTDNHDDPKLQRLRAPVADARALGRVLEDPSIGGFRVQLALDDDESSLTRRLALDSCNIPPTHGSTPSASTRPPESDLAWQARSFGAKHRRW